MNNAKIRRRVFVTFSQSISLTILPFVLCGDNTKDYIKLFIQYKHNNISDDNINILLINNKPCDKYHCVHNRQILDI